MARSTEKRSSYFVSNDIVTPTKADLRSLIGYLTIFEAPDFNPGSIEGDGTSLPMARLARPASRFVDELYDRKFVYAFDWPAWQEEAETYFNDLKKLDAASLDTIRRLFFVILRKERFCEGTVLEAFHTRFVVAALRRLRALATKT